MNTAADAAAAQATTRRVLGKVDALDGVRGVAVLLVLLHHLRVAAPAVGYRVVRGGEFGVDAFFVLSGFLITALMLQEQTGARHIRMGAFYRRRAMRILPAVTVFLASYWLYATMTHLHAAHAHWLPVPSEVFNDLLKPWRRLPLSIGISHLWSLAVEEQFYLVWPICVALLVGMRRRSTTAIVATLALVVAVAAHRATLWAHGVPWFVLYTRLDTRADALLVGCLLARLWIDDRIPKLGLRLAAWIGLCFYLGVVRLGASNGFLYWGGYTLIALAVGVVIAAVLETNWSVKRALSLTPLRIVGRVSYGLYIWHLAVFAAVGRYGKSWPLAAQVLIALGGSAVATYLSWSLVERPFLRWKNRLEHGPRQAEELRSQNRLPNAATPQAAPAVD